MQVLWRMVMNKRNSQIKIKTAKHDFDLLRPSKSINPVVRKATAADVLEACAFCAGKIPGSSPDASLINNIIMHNTDNIFVFLKNNAIIGIYAMLMLNPLGLERLLLGEFNTKNPDFICLTKTKETPAAIYVWSYIAPGKAANGIRNVSQFLQQKKYRNINFFARPVTTAGFQITQNLGYEPLENTSNGLFRYVRLINREPNMQRVA
jgi:hypothetical protein